MTESIPMLIVEDDPQIGKLLLRSLASEGRSLSLQADGRKALELLSHAVPDLLLLDLGLPGVPGLDLLRAALKKRPDCVAMILTSDAAEANVIEAMRLGAWDFFSKDTPFEQLEAKIGAAESEARRRRKGGVGLQPDGDQKGILIGRSAAMVSVFKQVGALAPSSLPVLITGESGSGKERVAKALHAYGAHPEGPYVTVDCASIPANLLESELFGYEKGAFSGAVAAKKGRFEEAHGGTLFLDEVGNLSADAAAKLLRALQEKTTQRLGSNQPIAWDARVVSATNVDLWARAKKGEFREDLAFRLAGAEIKLPPLRERPGDLEILAAHFLAKSGAAGASLSTEALALMKAYPWPGNVRELEHAVARGVAMARGLAVLPEHLPDAIRGASPMAKAGLKPASSADELIPLDDVKRGYARYAVEICRGNRAEAAKKLGLDPRTLATLLGDEA